MTLSAELRKPVERMESEDAHLIKSIADIPTHRAKPPRIESEDPKFEKFSIEQFTDDRKRAPPKMLTLEQVL
jgi:hypothetical protein